MNKNSKRKGQSLMEVLVAMAIGGLIIGSSVVALTMVIRTNFESKQVGIASLLLQEMIDSARSMAEGSWRAVYDVEKGEPAYIVRDEDGFNLIHGVEGVLIDEVTSGLVGHWKFDEGGAQNPNLVTNWNGFMGNNTNFSQFTYDTSDSHSGDGMFAVTSGSTTRNTDELIPVDVNKRYVWSHAIKLIDDNGQPGDWLFYSGLSPYDSQGRFINTRYALIQGNTRTELADPLSVGDTTIHLVDASSWHNGTSPHRRKINFYPYTDELGETYPVYGYSRLVFPDGGSASSEASAAWDAGGISGNVITLKEPWSGPEYPAGTKVANAQEGGTHNYIGGQREIPAEWTVFEGFIEGEDDGGVNEEGKFRSGTRYVRPLWLLNRDGSGSATTAVDAVVFREVEDEGVYVEKVYDSSTKGNHAVLSEEPNRPTRISAEGCRISFCLEFDGEGDYVSIGTPDELYPTDEITIATWARADDIERTTFNNVMRSGSRGVEIQERGDGFWRWYVNVNNSWGYIRWTDEKVEPGRWYHIVGTYDAETGDQKLYIDGKFKGETNRGTNNPITYSGINFVIGASSSPTSRNFLGAIDDFRVYNRALSEEEVNRLYRSRFFTRYLTVSNVGRDAEGNILQTGGTDDPSTQKITGSITWENGPTLTAVEYITRFRNEIDHIRDWRDSSTYDEQEGIEVTPEGGLTLPQPEE